jgi:hypothetical protein
VVGIEGRSHGIRLQSDGRGHSRYRWIWIAGTAGGLWGSISYAVLWGYTSIQPTRDFVDSNAGLVSLFPVRLVLESIRLVERHVVHHAFDFSRNHDWIGLVSTAVGALVLLLPAMLAAELLGRRRRGR